MAAKSIGASSRIEDSHIYELDPVWAEQYLKACQNPWQNGILALKTIELICVGLCAASTNMQETPSRRHIKAALAAGASQNEILMILKMGAVMSIHSMSLGAPILLEEANASVQSPKQKNVETPHCDKMHEIGQWNTAWDPFLNLDPLFTDQFMACGMGIYGSKVFSAKEIELFSIAFDASITHMYAPGTSRHIKAALKAGASKEEVMEVLKVCVAFGLESYRQGSEILFEELQALNSKS